MIGTSTGHGRAAWAAWRPCHKPHQPNPAGYRAASLEPTSLLDADRVLAELGRVSASLSTRKRTLRRCDEGTYRDKIAAACFARACGDVSLVLFDVTTLYFT